MILTINQIKNNLLKNNKTFNYKATYLHKINKNQINLMSNQQNLNKIYKI